MSVEIRLAQPCSHLIVEEPVTIGTDRRTLVTGSPVASTNSVRILVNDEVFIPSTGLYEQAILVGDTQGPFRVPVCDRTLTVATSTGQATVTLTPDGSGLVSPTAIARALTAKLPDAVVTVEENRLVIADYGSLGPASRVLASGPGAAHVGFSVQRGASGVLVYPGWYVTGRPSSDEGRYPVFREPLRANPDIKVSYVSVPTRCRRCVGTYVENDWQYSLQGDVLMINNEDLLVQAALKILLTRLRSNVYHPEYGTTIMDRIGSKAIGPVAAQISQEVRAALNLLSASQSKQLKWQAVSAKERLYAVRSVNVTQDANDPTVFNVDVVASNASNDPISVSIVYTAPGAVALTGSNGLSLGGRG